MQLQIHYPNYSTPEQHHTTSSSCEWGDRPGDHCNHCNHSKKHNSNHLSVHQWVRSAIRDSQPPTSPIGFLVWNFRHRLVRYYWFLVVSKNGDTQKMEHPIKMDESCSHSKCITMKIAISGVPQLCISPPLWRALWRPGQQGVGKTQQLKKNQGWRI